MKVVMAGCLFDKCSASPLDYSMCLHNCIYNVCVCVCEGVSMCVCVCVCVCEGVSMCVFEGVSMCACVCVRE